VAGTPPTAATTARIQQVETSPTTAQAARIVSYLNGQIRYTLGEVPLLGDPSAEHIFVEYFDYKCPGCRQLHSEVQELLKRYPSKIAMIVIPTPLDRRCNPHLPQSLKDHPGACELARLGLAVWKADPKRFSSFHDKLFREQESISLARARQFAVELVGKDALARAEVDPYIENSLSQSMSIYAQLSSKEPRLPKVLIGGMTIVNGVPKDTDTLVRLFKEAYHVD
jgi:protein-disulfide isomerase